MKRFGGTRMIVVTAMVAAVYVAFTFALYGLSYQAVQFRFSELMVFLAFIDPLYIPGLVLGCFIANIFGPFGLVDAVFGSVATLFSVFFIYLSRRYIRHDLTALTVASLWPSVSSLIIAFEIVFIAKAPESYWYWVAMVALGEFLVVTVCGVPVWSLILKKPAWIARLRQIRTNGRTG